MRYRHLSPSLILLLSLTSAVIILRPLDISAANQPAIPLQKTWGGSGDESANAIALDSNGNIYLAGSTSSFGGGITLLKYDSSGSLLWQKRWSGSGNGTDSASGVAVDSLGYVYLAGSTTSFGAGGSDILLLKFFASNGSIVWARTWGSSKYEVSVGLALDYSSIFTSGLNVYVAGTAAYGTSAVLLKFSSAGSLLAQWYLGGYGGTGYEGCPYKETVTFSGTGLAVDSTGSAYLSVQTLDSYVILPNGNPACMGGITYFYGSLYKFATNGSFLFSIFIGANDVHVGRMTIDSSGNLYIVGSAGGDVLLMKLNSTGGNLWQRTWGGTKTDIGTAAAVDPSSGDIYVTGYTSSFGAGGYDALLLKFTSSGSLSWSKIWGASKNDFGSGVAVDSSGNALVSGSVGESGPYALGSGNNTVGIPKLGLPAWAGSAGPSTGFTLNTPPGSVSTPSGSESYAGGSDEFLFKTGPLQMITFTMSPSVGTVVFNSTTYGPLQNGNYTQGSASATANPPLGYSFTSWTSTGGVSVSSNTTNPTTVIIKSTGTLTANFKSPNQAPLTPGAISILALATSTALLLRRRRKAS